MKLLLGLIFSLVLVHRISALAGPMETIQTEVARIDTSEEHYAEVAQSYRARMKHFMAVAGDVRISEETKKNSLYSQIDSIGASLDAQEANLAMRTSVGAVALVLNGLVYTGSFEAAKNIVKVGMKVLPQ